MPKFTRKIVVLAKEETTYGQDATPAGNHNAILVNEGIEFKASAEKESRKVVRQSFSPAGHVVGVKSAELSFDVEARGGGWQNTDPLPPDYGILLRICGMADDDTQTGKLIYRPVSDYASMQSATLYFYRDGILHKLVGCRGSWSLDLSVGKFGVFKFTLSGLWVDPTDTPLPDNVTTTDISPPTVTALGLAIGSYTPVGVTAISLDIANQVAKRQDVNADDGISEIFITGRTPSGSLDPETDSLSNFNPWHNWETGTKAAISCTVGTAQGNRFAISCPANQWDDPGYTDTDGLLKYSLPFLPTSAGAGDDELAITFT